jgi:hypothetical protein
MDLVVSIGFGLVEYSTCASVRTYEDRHSCVRSSRTARHQRTRSIYVGEEWNHRERVYNSLIPARTNNIPDVPVSTQDDMWESSAFAPNIKSLPDPSTHPFPANNKTELPST